MWLREYHIDGLRLDAVHAFIDRSAIHFMEQIANESSSASRSDRQTLRCDCESDLNDPRLIRAHEAGGYEMDSQWSDDFHHALVALPLEIVVGTMQISAALPIWRNRSNMLMCMTAATRNTATACMADQQTDCRDRAFLILAESRSSRKSREG